jgi:hypothetical protein
VFITFAAVLSHSFAFFYFTLVSYRQNGDELYHSLREL